MTTAGGTEGGGKRGQVRDGRGEETREGGGKGIEEWNKKWYEGRSKGGKMEEGGETGDTDVFSVYVG